MGSSEVTEGMPALVSPPASQSKTPESAADPVASSSLKTVSNGQSPSRVLKRTNSIALGGGMTASEYAPHTSGLSKLISHRLVKPVSERRKAISRKQRLGKAYKEEDDEDTDSSDGSIEGSFGNGLSGKGKGISGAATSLMDSFGLHWSRQTGQLSEHELKGYKKLVEGCRSNKLMDVLETLEWLPGNVVNIRGPDGYFVIHVAIAARSWGSVKLLLEVDNIDVSVRTEESWNTPLLHVIKRASVDDDDAYSVCEGLLSRGASVFEHDKSGLNAISVALRKRMPSLLKLLVSEAQSQCIRGPIDSRHVPQGRQQRESQVLASKAWQYMVSFNKNSTSSGWLIDVACSTDHSDAGHCLQALVDQGLSVTDGAASPLALCISLMGHNLTVAEHFINGSKTINAHCSLTLIGAGLLRNSALHAFEEGSVSPPKCKHASEFHNFLKCLGKGRGDVSAFEIASFHKQDEILNRIAGLPSFNPNFQFGFVHIDENLQGCFTPLSYAIRRGMMQLVSLLLLNGADPNLVLENASKEAMKEGPESADDEEQIASKMSEISVPSSVTDGSIQMFDDKHEAKVPQYGQSTISVPSPLDLGRSPLMWAVVGNHSAIFKKLVHHPQTNVDWGLTGQSPVKPGSQHPCGVETALRLVAERGFAAHAWDILERANIKLDTEALSLAAVNGHDETCAVILNHGEFSLTSASHGHGSTRDTASVDLPLLIQIAKSAHQRISEINESDITTSWQSLLLAEMDTLCDVHAQNDDDFLTRIRHISAVIKEESSICNYTADQISSILPLVCSAGHVSTFVRLLSTLFIKGAPSHLLFHRCIVNCCIHDQYKILEVMARCNIIQENLLPAGNEGLSSLNENSSDFEIQTEENQISMTSYHDKHPFQGFHCSFRTLSVASWICLVLGHYQSLSIVAKNPQCIDYFPDAMSDLSVSIIPDIASFESPKQSELRNNQGVPGLFAAAHIWSERESKSHLGCLALAIKRGGNCNVARTVPVGQTIQEEESWPPAPSLPEKSSYSLQKTTMLHLLVKQGHVKAGEEACKLAISHGADINAVDENDNTAASLCVLLGNESLCLYIIGQKGANVEQYFVNLLAGQVKSWLHNSQGSMPKLFHRLFPLLSYEEHNRQKDPNIGAFVSMPLVWAALRCNWIDVCHSLITNGCGGNAVDVFTGASLLHGLCALGWVNCVSALLTAATESFASKVGLFTDYRHCDPGMIAALAGNWECLSMLLQAGSRRFSSYLVVSCLHGMHNCAAIVLWHAATKHKLDLAPADCESICGAIHKSHFEFQDWESHSSILRKIQQQELHIANAAEGFSGEYQDISLGVNLASSLACRTGGIQVLPLLALAGADFTANSTIEEDIKAWILPNSPPAFLPTWIHNVEVLGDSICINMAAASGSFACVDWLLSSGGCSPDSVDYNGMSPLICASIYGNTAIMKLLICSGANVHLYEDYVQTVNLFLHAREKWSQLLSACLEKQVLEQKSFTTGIKGAFFSVDSGDASVIIPTQPGFEITIPALIWAAAYNQVHSIRVLLESGADSVGAEEFLSHPACVQWFADPSSATRALEVMQQNRDQRLSGPFGWNLDGSNVGILSMNEVNEKYRVSDIQPGSRVWAIVIHQGWTDWGLSSINFCYSKHELDDELGSNSLSSQSKSIIPLAGDEYISGVEVMVGTDHILAARFEIQRSLPLFGVPKYIDNERSVSQAPPPGMPFSFYTKTALLCSPGSLDGHASSSTSQELNEANHSVGSTYSNPETSERIINENSCRTTRWFGEVDGDGLSVPVDVQVVRPHGREVVKVFGKKDGQHIKQMGFVSRFRSSEIPMRQFVIAKHLRNLMWPPPEHKGIVKSFKTAASRRVNCGKFDFNAIAGTVHLYSHRQANEDALAKERLAKSLAAYASAILPGEETLNSAAKFHPVYARRNWHRDGHSASDSNTPEDDSSSLQPHQGRNSPSNSNIHGHSSIKPESKQQGQSGSANQSSRTSVENAFRQPQFSPAKENRVANSKFSPSAVNSNSDILLLNSNARTDPSLETKSSVRHSPGPSPTSMAGREIMSPTLASPGRKASLKASQGHDDSKIPAHSVYGNVVPRKSISQIREGVQSSEESRSAMSHISALDMPYGEIPVARSTLFAAGSGAAAAAAHRSPGGLSKVNDLQKPMTSPLAFINGDVATSITRTPAFHVVPQGPSPLTSPNSAMKRDLGESEDAIEVDFAVRREQKDGRSATRRPLSASAAGQKARNKSFSSDSGGRQKQRPASAGPRRRSGVLRTVASPERVPIADFTSLQAGNGQFHFMAPGDLSHDEIIVSGARSSDDNLPQNTLGGFHVEGNAPNARPNSPRDESSAKPGLKGHHHNRRKESRSTRTMKSSKRELSNSVPLVGASQVIDSRNVVGSSSQSYLQKTAGISKYVSRKDPRHFSDGQAGKDSWTSDHWRASSSIKAKSKRVSSPSASNTPSSTGHNPGVSVNAFTQRRRDAEIASQVTSPHRIVNSNSAQIEQAQSRDFQHWDSMFDSIEQSNSKARKKKNMRKARAVRAMSMFLN